MHADKFVAYEDGIYLLNHSVGRPPRSAQNFADTHFFQHWQTQADDVWPQWLQEIDGFRQALARLLNSPFENFCPQTNLSGALTKVLGALPRDSGRNVIVYCEQDFPSIGFVLEQAKKQGLELRCIDGDSDVLDLQTWSQQLDEEVLCVLVTHVHSNTSLQVDVAGICQLARAQGVVSIVDIAQSVGVVPIDLQTWQADFVLGSCVKWLCGGPGAGFLWADPNIVNRCEPTDVGWWSHANPFEFNIHDFRYAEGVLRFWGGTPSVLPYVVAHNSIELISDIGLETIRAHNLAYNRKILNHLAEGVALTPQVDSQRGGTLVLNFDEHQPDVEQRLTDSGVRFDSRATGLRISPHIYNNELELDVVLPCLQA
jgi:kynureninase